MVYFSGVRCSECGDISHEGCISHGGHLCPSSATVMKQKSNKPVNSNDDDDDPNAGWKVMSLDTEVANFEATYGHLQPEGSIAASRKSSFSAAVAMSGLLKVVHWLSQRRRHRETTSRSSLDKSVRDKSMGSDKNETKQSRKQVKSVSKKRNSLNNVPAGILANGEGRSRHASFQKLGCGTLLQSPNGSLSSSGFTSWASSAAQTPSDSESDYRILREKVLRLHVAASPLTGGWIGGRHQGLSGMVTTVAGDGRTCKPRVGQSLSVHGRFGRLWLTKAKTFSMESKGCAVERLCATWPPIGKNVTTIDETIDDTESGIGDCDEQDTPCRRNDVKDTLGEWCIPFGDLEIKERIRHGRHGDIYRGHWHGEVLIYTFRHHSEHQIRHFWEEVAQLSMIRHENVVLFMGACVDPPRLAIVTSMRKGPSLYEHIHIKKHHLTFNTKLNIARQIAQAMGYLHAKGIIHRNLNSMSIILETRVKLCLLDQGMPEIEKDRPDYGCIPRGHLTYLSPELIKNLRVDPPEVIVPSNHTQESDVYSFGSLLYELLAEHYPHSGRHPHTIIWMTAAGRHQRLDDLKCTGSLKALLVECWSLSTQRRPSFAGIVRELQENVPLHKRHSSSEPERLHQLGLGIGRGLYS